jgi:hypothetical protein
MNWQGRFCSSGMNCTPRFLRGTNELFSQILVYKNELLREILQ